MFRPSLQRLVLVLYRLFSWSLYIINWARGLAAKLLEGDDTVIERLVVIVHHFPVLSFSYDNAGVSPAEVVHAPEGVQRQEKGVYRVTVTELSEGSQRMVNKENIRAYIDDHPSDQHELSLQQENHGLETIDDTDHDERDDRNGS